MEEINFKVGDRASSLQKGSEMGTVKSVDIINQSVVVEYSQKFNGKETLRERTFPVKELLNRTEVNKELGKTLLKEVNEALKAGQEIAPEKALEQAYKNEKMTEKVGNGIGLISAHLKQLTKDGLVTEEDGKYKLAKDVAAEKLDDIKVDTNINGLVANNAAGKLKESLGKRIDNWIMHSTDVKAMGTGWNDFKSTYNHIVDGARAHGNQFYSNNSKEFAALDQIVTEVLAATFSATAVTAKWGAKNIGRAAYNFSKSAFAKIQANKQVKEVNKVSIIPQALKEARGMLAANRQAKEAFSNFHAEAQKSREEMRSEFQKQPTHDQQAGDKFERGESVWNTAEGKATIEASKQEKNSIEPETIKTDKSLSTTQFTKKIEQLKSNYAKDLLKLNEKYDKKLEDLKKEHDKEKNSEKKEEQVENKHEEKEESRGR